MYKDWFSKRADAQLNYYIYVRDPKHLLPDEIARQDQSAARYIKEAQQLIQGLTEYRAARVGATFLRAQSCMNLS